MKFCAKIAGGLALLLVFGCVETPVRPARRLMLPELEAPAETQKKRAAEFRELTKNIRIRGIGIFPAAIRDEAVPVAEILDRAEALGLVIAPPAAPNSLGNGKITATACSASVQTATAKGKGDGEKHERLSFNGSEDNLLFTAYTFKKKSLKGWRVNGVTVKGAKHSSTLWLKKVDRDVNVEAVYQLPEAADSSVSCTVTARNAYIQRMTSKEKATGSTMEELQLSKSENLIITAKVPKGKRITGWSVNGQIIQFSNTSKTLKLFGVDCDVEVEPIFA